MSHAQHEQSTIVKRLAVCIAVMISSVAFSYAADITFTPSTGTFKQGKSFTVDVYVSNNNQTINAVSAAITYPSDLLQITSINKDSSIIKLWAEEPSFSNAQGTAKLEGVILNPGFSSARGKVVSINFVAKKAGTAAVVVGSGSVLANDGNASNVTGTLGTGSYEITTVAETPTAEEVVKPVVSVRTVSAPELRSLTHPSQDAWYSSRDVSFEWVLPQGVTAVRTLYDDKPASTPSKIYDPPINNRSFVVDADGSYYMHVQFKTSAGWGDVAHYKFNVDSQAPEKLDVSVPDGSVTANPQPMLSIVTSDAVSGIDRITLTVANQEPIIYQKQESLLYKSPRLIPGKNTVTVTSFDKSGNSKTYDIVITLTKIDPPTITDYPKYVQEGSVVKVTGTTYPDATAEIIFVDRSGNETTARVVADTTGSFSLFATSTLSAGVYELKPRTIDQKGARSEFGETKVIVIEKATLIRIGMFIMNWLSLALIIVIAAVSFTATLWFSLIQFRRFRRKVRRTMEDAESTLRVNVQALRRDTEEFRTVLVKAQKKRELTKEETVMLKKFGKRLEITEHEIEKKLEQLK